MRSLVGLAIVGGAALLALSSSTEVDAKKSRRAEIIELGRRLFMDPLGSSRAGRTSCAACHDPEHGFSDVRRLSSDENGESTRHSQPLHDLKDGAGYHWDGEFITVNDLLEARLAPPTEALNVARRVRQSHFDEASRTGRNPDAKEFQRRMRTLAPPYYEPQQPLTPVPTPLLRRLQLDESYKEGFKRAFNTTSPKLDQVIDALNSYVMSIKTDTNAYDRYVAGDPAALTEQQRAGLRVFQGKANCASCHTAAPDKSGERVRFTDDAFHNTGVAFRQVKMTFDGGGKGDGGFGEMSLVKDDLGKFKTPTLRDVARRAPYMHDGSLKTLREVVDYYDQGGTTNGTLSSHIQPLRLTDVEKDALVSFLEALSGEKRAGLAPARRDRAGKVEFAIEDLGGTLLPDMDLEIWPAGDRLVTARSATRKPLFVRTDKRGRVRFEFPQWTHVRVKARGHTFSRLIPDYVRSKRLIAVPDDKVAVRILDAKTLPATIVAYRSSATRRGPKIIVGVFKRVRKFKSTDALYVAARGKNDGWVDVHLDYAATKGGRARPVVRPIDMRGGLSLPLDLRPQR